MLPQQQVGIKPHIRSNFNIMLHMSYNTEHREAAVFNFHDVKT